MPLPSRSEPEVRRSLLYTVAWRWPRERLLLTTSCTVERVAGRAEWLLTLLGRAHCPGGACAVDTTFRRQEALVGVTDGRLVYEERMRHGMFLRITGLFLLGIAMLVLLAGAGVGHAFALAGAGAACWLGGGLARRLGVGAGHVEFRRVQRVDRARQWIVGLSRWGTVYRLRIPDVNDFRLVAALAERRGLAA
jgi:hypothetical protein